MYCFTARIDQARSTPRHSLWGPAGHGLWPCLYPTPASSSVFPAPVNMQLLECRSLLLPGFYLTCPLPGLPFPFHLANSYPSFDVTSPRKSRHGPSPSSQDP